MAFIDDIASKLSGRTRAETNSVMTDATTRTYVGTATSASEDGSVYVALSQDVTLPEDDDGEHGLGVEMPTTVAVDEGDEVLVTVFGGGVMKAPVVTGNPGWGDNVQAQVDNAETLAQQAEAVAQEASAEVEQVRQDVADFRDDVATTYATKVEREDGDDAVKTWVTTNYTNSNDLATTYATKTLVSQTKDAIELAASQTYETQSDAAATYATKSALTVGLDGIRSEVAEDYQPKGDYATTASMNSAIQQSASSIESSVAATYETQSDAAATYATKTEVQQTASGLDTRITTAQSTADGAASTASTAAGNASTALSTANDALADSVEYIIGTQTAATNAWTGQTRDAALVAGKTIAYKLPYAGTGTAATLNLTLSGGGTTGAKGVRRMADNNANYTVTTQYGAGAVLQMTYDGEYWRVSSGYNPTTDINNARYRTQIPSAVKAAAAYNTGHIICGTSEGYKNIGAGVAFDLGYPLLYTTASVAAGATGKDNYLEFENRNASTNGTIQSGAANKTLYLKGTVSGNTFTIAASPFMTTVTPTSEDGFCYIPLGLMYSATNIYFQSSDQLYAYTEGAFQPIGKGALATAQAEVTERQTLIRQFSGGVLAGYVGNAIAALVNAAGSFDVVRTAWANGVPSILGTLATFGANLIRIGEETGQNVLITSTGQLFRDGLNNLLSLVVGTAHTETFTIESYVYDPNYSYMATHTIGVEHIAIQSVTFDGSEFPKFSATTRRGWVYKKSTNLLSLRFYQSDSALGKQVTVRYRTFASMVIYDGTGNDAENIAASFSADDIMLGGNIDGDVDDDKASIRFFGGSVDTETTYIDASGGIGTSSITGDPCYLNREIELGNIVTDSRLYDDSGRRANGFVSFAQSISDSYNTGGETTSSYVNSYVSMYSGTNDVANYAAITATSVDNLLDSSTSDTETYTEVSARADRLRLEDTSGDAIIPMPQAIVALQQPYAMFVGSSSTATSTANGWRITWFNTVYSHSPNWSDYFSFSNGVITAKRNIQLEISGCMNWTDSVAGNRGFGVFYNSSTVGSGTEYSEFQMFPNTVNNRKSVWMAGLVLSLDANVKCAVGRYENNGAVYVNGTNFSRILLKVLGTY